jgi:hypothetical protein
MAEAFHQVVREIAAQAFEEVHPHDGGCDEAQIVTRGQHLVDDGFHQVRHRRRRSPVHNHRQRGAGDHGPVRSRVTKKAQKSVHQESVSEILVERINEIESIEHRRSAKPQGPFRRNGPL